VSVDTVKLYVFIVMILVIATNSSEVVMLIEAIAK
jgi:hypothetical protein